LVEERRCPGEHVDVVGRIAEQAQPQITWDRGALGVEPDQLGALVRGGPQLGLGAVEQLRQPLAVPRVRAAAGGHPPLHRLRVDSEGFAERLVRGAGVVDGLAQLLVDHAQSVP
jgi:hypothetical protein